MPLGLKPTMGYEEKKAVLEVGDSTLFYSDGLVEATIPSARCSAFRGFGGWSWSTVKKNHW
jgi:serine phosphatase RsbU (regulator of sigma subunit)